MVYCLRLYKLFRHENQKVLAPLTAGEQRIAFHNGSPGGGVLIAVKNSILATRESALEEDSCEAVWCKIHIAGSRPLYNGCFYRKPDHHLEAVCGLDNAVNKVTSSICIPNILITGDFNLPHINWDSCDNENKYHMHNNLQYGTAVNQALLDIVNHHSKLMRQRPYKEQQHSRPGTHHKP